MSLSNVSTAPSATPRVAFLYCSCLMRAPPWSWYGFAPALSLPVLGWIVVFALAPVLHVESYVLLPVDDLAEILDDSQFVVVHLVDPGNAPDGVLRVEEVREGGVVHDHRVLQIPSEQAQVLHVVALVLGAALPKEAVADDPADVQLVEQRVGVLVQGGRVDDHLVLLAAPPQVLVHPRPLAYVHVVHHVFDLHGYDVVRVGHGAEARVDQGLVQVQHEAKLPLVLLRHGGQDRLVARVRGVIIVKLAELWFVALGDGVARGAFV
mmetsp:Transcript_2806/g.6253  ORF Transcript_2806/g.6253 Transcript_2806/m.6253 type:complete len:265 (-) Transcript_2806:467-1261(-)